jgi:outer membrane protein OmpA-like peptidoglycan-associated protein
MNKFNSVVSLGVLLLAGCGSVAVSKELATARDAYTNAKNGPAAALNPAGLHEAHGFLVRAEQARADDPGSAEERSLAYVAERRVHLALSEAEEVAAKRDQAAAEEAFKADLIAEGGRLKQQSDSYSEQLKDAKGDLKDAKGDIAASEQARAAAERRTLEALKALEALAAVKQEQNRIVITLSGSVLFKSGDSTLLDVAKTRLKSVAEALSAYGSAAITVSGHTDSRGSDEANLKLSQSRADAVRNYLISQGLVEVNIVAVGKGESMPVAGNDTPEGQSSNRRVEIEVNRSPVASIGTANQ